MYKGQVHKMNMMLANCQRLEDVMALSLSKDPVRQALLHSGLQMGIHFLESSLGTYISEASIFLLLGFYLMIRDMYSSLCSEFFITA